LLAGAASLASAAHPVAVNELHFGMELVKLSEQPAQFRRPERRLVVGVADVEPFDQVSIDGVIAGYGCSVVGDVAEAVIARLFRERLDRAELAAALERGRRRLDAIAPGKLGRLEIGFEIVNKALGLLLDRGTVRIGETLCSALELG
jgi:hypothetical protein